MEYLAFFGPLRGYELIIILVAVLIVFGPKNLPKLGRMIGSALREFKGAAHKATDSLDDDDDEPVEPARLEKKSVAASTEKKEKESVG